MRARSRSIQAVRSTAYGFTLVELMVTLVIFALVAVTLSLVLMNSAKSKQRTSQRIESAQQARAALDLMARDIRSAGYGVDRDYPVTPQQAIAYVDSQEIILAENQSPYPANPLGPTAPLAYNPAANPKPFPLVGTAYTPPGRYHTGAELIRYTLDVNNDGVVNASDISSPQGADAASTPNPNDYVLVRQVYGDSTGNVANNNGGTTESVALVTKPGTAGAPPLFNVYMRGSSTPWDWSSGPVPANQLANIQRVELQVTAASSRPDARGTFAQTTLKSEVNAARSVPDFGAATYSVSGFVYNDLNSNHVMDGSDVGLPGATVRLGSLVAYTNSAGFYQLNAPAGSYVLKHTPAMGYGTFTVPDSFNVQVTTAALTRSFADTARKGGNVTMSAFNDLNGNGYQDTGEGLLPGIRFTIAPGTPEVTSAVSNASGYATLFTSTGGFSVTCNNPDTMMVTTSAGNPVSGSITNGGTASVVFGLNSQVTGKVSGKVFVDADRNGLWGTSEAGLPNVWVGASKDGGLTVASYTYSDASGNYTLSMPVNDPPHTTAYAIYIVPPAGYFPTVGTTISPVWVQQTPTVTGKNFGLAAFQVISLTASRVLSLAAADLIESDWNGNHPENAHQDQDLILGADAGSTDNVSVWFNKYPASPLFGQSASKQDPDYSRLAPNSVMCMAVDTLDKNDTKARPDLVTGTKFTAGGNFFVWFTQGSSGNEGFLPTNYSPSQNYRTQDNGDVQTVATLDCGGGAMPDILVGTKGATAGQGSIEVWLNSDATTPTFTRDETYTSFSGSLLGEVTGMTLADLDNDGDKDLIVVTRQSDYSGQLVVFENRGRTAGNRFVYRFSDTYNNDSPTSVAVLDADGDGWKDIFVGTQRSTSSGRIFEYKNAGAVTPYTFASPVRRDLSSGFPLSLNAGDFGGSVTRNELAVGWRASTGGFTGGILIYSMDLAGIISSAGTDPSAGSVQYMVPAIASANFNYALNTGTSPPSPFLNDLAVAVKSSSTTGALVIFIR